MILNEIIPKYQCDLDRFQAHHIRILGIAFAVSKSNFKKIPPFGLLHIIVSQLTRQFQGNTLNRHLWYW